MSLKATCKYLFPGEFSNFIKKIESAYDETDKREKKRKYLELNKEFNKLKKSKRNGCNNSNSIEKKIDTISLLLVVLQYDIELNETNMVKIYHELDELDKELDKLNISIDSVNKGEKILRKKVKELYERIKFSSNIDELIKNMKLQKNLNNINEKRAAKRLNNLTKRLTTLKLGGTRKNRLPK